MAKKRRPPTKTLQRVFDWLQEHGMSVYGPYRDGDTIMGGHCDYDVELALELAQLVDKGKLKVREEEE